MTNFEKYKTPQEAAEVFYSYCNNTRCQYCKFFENYAIIPCIFQWLYADDEENQTPQWQNDLMDKFITKE